MTIVRWNPTGEARPPMARAFDHFFESFPWTAGAFPWTTEHRGIAVWEPYVDMYETPEELVLRAELPGMKRDDIQLNIQAGALTISGQREADNEASVDNYHRIERRYGRFTRGFRLPTLVEEDKIAATYEDGVLTVRLPKAASARPRRIEIAA